LSPKPYSNYSNLPNTSYNDGSSISKYFIGISTSKINVFSIIAFEIKPFNLYKIDMSIVFGRLKNYAANEK